MDKLCIFCGKRVNSKEHVWPQWLLDVMEQWPKPIQERRLQAFRLNKQGGMDKWESPRPEVVVRNVCVTCNGGWMSDLENLVKPILVPMIGGTPVNLTFKQQAYILTWAIKCAMVFDSKDSVDSFYEETERLHFGKTLSPLNSFTDIWLGHYSGPEWNGFSKHGTLHAAESVPPHNGYVLTMVFGRLAIQFLHIKFLTSERRETLNIQVRNGQWDDITIRIASGLLRGPVQWPPRLSFHDSNHTIDEFADRFGFTA